MHFDIYFRGKNVEELSFVFVCVLIMVIIPLFYKEGKLIEIEISFTIVPWPKGETKKIHKTNLEIIYIKTKP